MIENEAQYQEARNRLLAQRNLFDQKRERFRRSGLPEWEIQRVMDPLERFHRELREEVLRYEARLWGSTKRLPA